MNETELITLIKKMDSDNDAVSWSATRRAEKIKDLSIFPYLKSLIEKKITNSEKMNIYFILSHLALSTNNREIENFLLQQLLKEQNRNVLSFLLMDLMRLEKIHDGSNVVPLVKHKYSTIRSEALEVLTICETPDTEEIFLEVLKTSQDEFELTAAIAGVKTERAIPLIQPLLYHKSGDVKTCSIGALAQLGGESQVPLFIELLEKSKSRYVKETLTHTLAEIGDERGIIPVCNRLKKVASRQRVVESYPSEITIGIAFLHPFYDQYNEIQSLYVYIKKKWNHLFEEEQEWLQKHVPFFRT
ncbi:HEAT repeat domain-containing protein [Cytobacillus sp. Hm23]